MFLLAAMLLAQAPECQPLSERVLVPRRQLDVAIVPRSGSDSVEVRWNASLGGRKVVIRRELASGKLSVALEGGEKVEMSSNGSMAYQALLPEVPMLVRVFRVMLDNPFMPIHFNAQTEAKSTCALDFTIGATWPNLSYQDRNETTRSLSGTRYTLLNYWASWCPPCLAAIPGLIEIGKTHPVDVIGINGDEDPRSAENARKTHPTPWPEAVSSNPPALVNHQNETRSFPLYVLLDPQRRVMLIANDVREVLRAIRANVKSD